MPSLDQQIANLQAAIAAQEGLRPSLGDAIVDATLAALRAQLDALIARQAGSPPVALMPAGDDPFSRYLPGELADKLRVAGMVEGERKQVTVVFADLSGFTALSERLDPEEVRSLQNDLFPEMAAAVYHYEGYVDKFIGDAIMAVFGAPIAHEDDPERALRAALDMRARIAQLNRTWQPRFGRALSLHVGINTGTVIAGDISAGRRNSYTVTGDAVNVASRLSDAAVPGQILVSRETYRLAQGAFDFAPLEPLTVKGKSEPLAVFELQRARLYPLKLRGLKELGSAFVARERESALLREVLNDLLAGRGRVVTVTGEAGLGKSRLLAEWNAEVGARARWREGRAFAHTAGMAYGPFLDFFRRYANIHDDDTEQEARAVLGEVVRRFFGDSLEAHALLASLLAMQLAPAEAELLAGLPAQTIRTRIFDAIAHMVEEPTRERPTILVLEDMHWSDSTSIDLAASLLELTKRVPLAIVVVCRPDPDAPSQRLLDIIRSGYADCVTSIALAPLSNDSTVQMLEQLLSAHHLPPALTTMICARAEGNPFYVEEVIRMLIERGVLMRTEAAAADGELQWQTTPLLQSVQVPNTLEGVLQARLDRLPVEAKWLAQQAAVIGRNFLYRVLVCIGDSSAGIDAELSYLERQELIREQARDPEIEYIFKHALTQDVAYHSLLAPRRKELHHRTGRALEELFAERLGEFSGLIAFHYLRGEVWDKAVAYLLRAGDDALGLYAHAEARQHYAAALGALDHLPDSLENRRRRVDTTTKLASVSIVAADPSLNLARLAQAESLARALPSPSGSGTGDALRLARIHYWMGRAHFYRNESREAIGYYRQVLAEGQESGDPELLALPSSTLGQVTVLIQGQFGKAAPLLAQAVAQLEKLHDWGEWIRAQGYLALATGAQGKYAEGLAIADQALARGRDTNNMTGVGLVLLLCQGIHLMARNHERVLETMQACLAINEQTGDRLQAYIANGMGAWAQSRLGQHPAAAARMAQSRAIGQSLGGRLVLADWFAVAGAELVFNAGRVDEAIPLAEQAIALTKGVGSAYSEGMAHRLLGQALAAGGGQKAEGGRRKAEGDRPEADRTAVPDAVSIGPAGERPQADRTAVPDAGSIRPADGGDARYAQARAELEMAVQLLESGGALLEAAHARLALGQLCLARGEREPAGRAFDRAAAQYEASGLGALLAETRAWQARAAVGAPGGGDPVAGDSIIGEPTT